MICAVIQSIKYRYEHKLHRKKSLYGRGNYLYKGHSFYNYRSEREKAMPAGERGRKFTENNGRGGGKKKKKKKKK